MNALVTWAFYWYINPSSASSVTMTEDPFVPYDTLQSGGTVLTDMFLPSIWLPTISYYP